MIKLLATAAMLSMQAASPPQAPRCLTRQQIGDIGVVASSILLDVMSDSCRPHLAASAFLSQPTGTAYLARLRVEADRRFPSAARLIMSIFGGEAIPPEMTRAQVQEMAASAASLAGLGALDPPLCREIDEIIDTMSGMSPDQVARFAAAFASLGQQFAAREAAARATAQAAAAPAAAPGDGDGEPAVPEAPRPSGPPLPPICSE
jgi:hypothetical protein